MAVARSYRDCKILCDPYSLNGRKYVDIETPLGFPKRVRYYSDAEYFKMYGEEFKSESEKDKLGFTNGYITIFKGNTYPHKDWLKENGARFSKLFNWSFPSGVDWPQDELPEDLTPITVSWESVSLNDTLLPENEIINYINSLRYEPSKSEYVGEVGDRITMPFTVKKTMTFDSYFGGISTMHIMEDESGNVFVWTTTSKAFPEGKEILLCGTIKEHKEYRGTKQTVLTRCKEVIQ